MILCRWTARAQTSVDEIENFVAIDRPIVSEFTGTLAGILYRSVYMSAVPDSVNGADFSGDFKVREEGARREQRLDS